MEFSSLCLPNYTCFVKFNLLKYTKILGIEKESSKSLEDSIERAHQPRLLDSVFF